MLFNERQVEEIVNHFTDTPKDEIEKYIKETYLDKEGSYLSLINSKTEEEIKLPFISTNMYDLSYILTQYVNIIMDMPAFGFEDYVINQLVINSHIYYLDSFDGEQYIFCCEDDSN